jgi:hypothetical protein
MAVIAVMDLSQKEKARAAGQGTSCMVWLWVVTTAFVVVTFITVKLRGYKKMPHALRDAIAADAIFGALLLLHSLL